MRGQGPEPSAREMDPVQYVRSHWAAADQPAAEHFAAMGALMRARQAMAAELDRLLKPHNLSRTAFLLMATLLMSDQHRRRLGQLSRDLLVHQTSVTHVVDQLEARAPRHSGSAPDRPAHRSGRAH